MINNSVELKNIVYTPLEAVAQANIGLNAHITKLIQSASDEQTDSNGKNVMKLKTIQLSYDKIRTESVGSEVHTYADNIGVEIPLLSIFAINSLKVTKSKVNFSAEICGFSGENGEIKAYAQVCSPNMRDGDNQARINYEIELTSEPITEGLARFVDMIGSQAMPKVHSTTPLDSNGRRLIGDEKEQFEHRRRLERREQRLTSRLQELTELIRMKNSALKLETGLEFDEYDEQTKNSSDKEAPKSDNYADIVKYKAIVAEIESDLKRVHDKKLESLTT
jgi:hypothetical protein